MLNVISFIRNNIGIFIVALFCLALWGLNTRNSQLTATNQRLEQMNDAKDTHIATLHSKNDGLAESVKSLTDAVRSQNEVVSQVAEQRAVTAQQNRKLQDEIKKYLASDKCAIAPVPADAVNRLRENADRIRSGKDTKPAIAGKPAG